MSTDNSTLSQSRYYINVAVVVTRAKYNGSTAAHTVSFAHHVPTNAGGGQGFAVVSEVRDLLGSDCVLDDIDREDASARVQRILDIVLDKHPLANIKPMTVDECDDMIGGINYERLSGIRWPLGPALPHISAFTIEYYNDQTGDTKIVDITKKSDAKPAKLHPTDGDSSLRALFRF